MIDRIAITPSINLESSNSKCTHSLTHICFEYPIIITMKKKIQRTRANFTQKKAENLEFFAI